MADFKDQVVLVTGAGKGTGRRSAEALAARGAIVAVNDISPINLDETMAHITSTGGRGKAYVEDIAKKNPVQTLLNQVLDDWSRIDILVNAAEVEPTLAVLEMDDWDWQRTLDVNLSGAFLLTQSVGRIMREKGRGIIIHIGERAKGLDRRAAYFASKAGLEALIKSASEELSTFGIHVHFVNPQDTGDVVERVIALCIKYNY